MLEVKTAGKISKFGISLSTLNEVSEIVNKLKIKVIGFHAHIGSGILDSNSWYQTASLLSEIVEHHKFPYIKILDLGGGLGVVEKDGQNELVFLFIIIIHLFFFFSKNLAELDELLTKFKKQYKTLELWLEPGRFLVASSGVLLSKVTQSKNKDGIHYIGINTGFNTFMRPVLYGSYHV